MNLEEIKDKFDMALAQRLTLDMAKCEVNFLLQGLAGFRTATGDLVTLPFTMKSEAEFPQMVSVFQMRAKAENYKEFVGISFAQTYLHYAFQAKEQEQAETSLGSLGSVEGNHQASSEPPVLPES